MNFIKSLLIIIALFSTVNASAATISVGVDFYGYETSSGSTGYSYTAGNYEEYTYRYDPVADEAYYDVEIVEARNWFGFNILETIWNTSDFENDAIPFIMEGVGSATLRLYSPNLSYQSQDIFETYTLYDYAHNGGVYPHFEDMGSGQTYGAINVSAADNGSYVDIILNDLAIADLNMAFSSGNVFYIGGAITTLSNLQPYELIFGNTNGVTAELIVSTSPVPIPAAVWLFGSGLIGLLGFSRRKKS